MPALEAASLGLEPERAERDEVGLEPPHDGGQHLRGAEGVEPRECLRPDQRGDRLAAGAGLGAAFESTELVGKLLQRTEARLEALERDPSPQAR